MCVRPGAAASLVSRKSATHRIRGRRGARHHARDAAFDELEVARRLGSDLDFRGSVTIRAICTLTEAATCWILQHDRVTLRPLIA